MTYKIEEGPNNTNDGNRLNFQHYQNKVGGGNRTAAFEVSGAIIQGVKFNEMYIGVDDIDTLISFLQQVKARNP